MNPPSNILNSLFAARPPQMMPQQFMHPNIMQQPFMMNGMMMEAKQDAQKPQDLKLETEQRAQLQAQQQAQQQQAQQQAQQQQQQQQARQGMVLAPPKTAALPKQPAKVQAPQGKGNCVDKDPQFCAWIKSKSPCTENYKVYCPLSCNAC